MYPEMIYQPGFQPLASQTASCSTKMMPSTNTVRRSQRLSQSGYYTEEGTPQVSHKEKLCRVFRRRISHIHGHMEGINSSHDFIAGDDHSDHLDVTDNEERTQASQTQTPDDRPSFRFTWSSMMKATFLLLVMLSFGIVTNTNMKLRAEVRSLRQHGNTFTPLADTMPNFASESQGARVCHGLSSNTYWRSKPAIWNVMDQMYHRWVSAISQRRVIQGHSPLDPGHCWCFPGARGHIVITLSHPISITHVTIGHITKSVSPYGNIASAPREFTVYGMRGAEQDIDLGRLVYDQDGPAVQTFKVPSQDKCVFSHVKLQIDSNWGNMDYTCLYNFRVHGQHPTE